MSERLRACKDCALHLDGVCYSPELADLVTGEPLLDYAGFMRNHEEYCGKGARYFRSRTVESWIGSLERRISCNEAEIKELRIRPVKRWFR